MKLKVFITKPELFGILSQYFGYTVTDVEISPIASSSSSSSSATGQTKTTPLDEEPITTTLLSSKKETSMADIIRAKICGLHYNTTEKILSIKSLMQLANEKNWRRIGLADAKWAVEHFPEFIKFVERNDRLPLKDYDSGLK